MNLLNWAYVVVATVCGTVAVQHLMVAARLRERRIYLTPVQLIRRSRRREVLLAGGSLVAIGVK